MAAEHPSGAWITHKRDLGHCFNVPIAAITPLLLPHVADPCGALGGWKIWQGAIGMRCGCGSFICSSQPAQQAVNPPLLDPVRPPVTLDAGVPDQDIPTLLDHVRPVHEVVPVDVYVPGCPPSADVIYFVLTELVQGRMPDLSAKTRFGA